MIERGLTLRFRVFMLGYLVLDLVDAVVGLVTPTYVHPRLAQKYGEALLWRALS